jgi:putative endonuclease
MTKDRIKLGQLGEGLAAAHIAEQGMLILNRNWRCSVGEIDIVALDRDQVVIVEVKTRRSARHGPPFEAVTPIKMARLGRLGAAWLANRGGRVMRIRVDVIGVTVDRDGTATVEHRKGLD